MQSQSTNELITAAGDVTNDGMMEGDNVPDLPAIS